MPRRASVLTSVLAGLVALCGAARAQQPTPAEAAEELLRQERIRATVEVALDAYLEDVDDPRERIERLVDGAEAIADAGPEAALYLVNEAEQGLYRTYYFTTYALGLLGTDEARAGLREAIRRANDEDGDYALSRKGWAGWCLALAGDPEAAATVNGGETVGGLEPIYRGVTAIEAIALLSGDDAVAALVEQYGRFASTDDVARIGARRYVALALGRTGSAMARETLLAALRDDPVGVVRRAAARALGWLPADDAVDRALVAALAGADPSVRHAAAGALADRLATARFDEVAARLKVEENAFVRGRLYKAVAALDPDRALAVLAEHAWRGDGTDRLELVAALRTLADPARLRLLSQAVSDPDNRVAAQATYGLAEIGTDDAAERLARAGEAAREAVADEVMARLAEFGDPRGIGLVSNRVIEGALGETVVDAKQRDRILRALEHLVRLDATRAIERLRRAATQQTDARLVAGIADVVARLETIRSNGDDVRKWVAAASDDDRRVRELAYRHLARIDGPEAAAGLVAALDRVEIDERSAVIAALGDVDAPPARAALRGLLMDPDVDGWRYEDVRAQAAWAARRIGGSEMRDLLVEAIDRREGADAYAFLALAQLDPQAAHAAYERWRLERLREARFDRGTELPVLDRMARTVAAGRAPSAWDLPPARVDLK